MGNANPNVKLMKDGKRLDGRSSTDIRKIRIEVGILPNAAGSAFIEWGGNKIICGVQGPRECIPKHGADPYKAVVKCRYMMAPFASHDEHGRSGPNRRSNELSKVIREVFESLIITEAFPKTQIDIYIEVLQAEGGTRVAAVTVAAVALSNAGIPMKDMVSAVAVGKADGEVIADLSREEDNFGQSDVPVAFSNRDGNILLLQMDGLMTRGELGKAMDIAQESSKKLYKLQTDALKEYYEKPHGAKKFQL
ncbi:MAG: exosome complex exonuclease Rrp41 [Candidatus Micrarchaeota archaeon]|nr:exosome complex exonuclease Rrp41 [Candidatus Micrarchaeota archaeon]